jgi:hypothetical protein
MPRVNELHGERVSYLCYFEFFPHGLDEFPLSWAADDQHELPFRYRRSFYCNLERLFERLDGVLFGELGVPHDGLPSKQMT